MITLLAAKEVERFGLQGSEGLDIEMLGCTRGIPGGGFLYTDGIKQDVDMATVRVNYTFGGPVVAKY